MDLASLKRKEARVRFEFDGEWLTYTYNPHMYDDDCQRILHNLSNEPDNRSVAGIFERLITSWDLRDDGREVPCNHETFLSLPPFLRTKILNTLIEDEMELGKLRGSDSGSNQERKSALVPIGSSRSSTSNGAE